jgi:bifunctional UDP-N-acetylglucosamine pyrophosphorylase/glucosamine-1-phosphate N-acetyltransferase
MFVMAARVADGSSNRKYLLASAGLLTGAFMTTTTTHPFAAIILAAGKGTRMKSDTHKVLHPIAGRAMLDHLLASVEELGPERLAVVVGAGREQIEAAVGARAATCLQEPQLGTGHAVQQAEGPLQGFAGDVLVLYGDVPFVKAATMRAMLERLNAADSPAAVVLGFEPADPLAYGRVIADDEGCILKMVEFKDADEGGRATQLCNSGLVAARAADLFALLARVGNDNAQGEYYLPDIVNIAIGDGRTCAVIVADTADEVAGINSRAELATAESRWQAARRIRAMDEGASLIAPETVFFSWDTVVGRDVTIEPNVFFGPGVTIADNVLVRANCHIEGARLASGVKVGPFARLRPGTVLGEGSFVGNFVEVKNAVLGVGAKASHLSYLGDATIGAGANIGAGTITCNYDGYFKYKTVIGERAFIGSNSSLIAPVTIGADAIVAAGSAVSRDVAPGELRMVRAEQLVKDGWADRFHDAMKKRKASEKKR